MGKKNVKWMWEGNGRNEGENNKEKVVFLMPKNFHPLPKNSLVPTDSPCIGLLKDVLSIHVHKIYVQNTISTGKYPVFTGPWTSFWKIALRFPTIPGVLKYMVQFYERLCKHFRSL